MQIFQSPLLLVLFCVLMTLHFVSGAFAPLIGKILRYANIVLHIAFFFVLMLCEIPLEEAALLYLISLFLYLAAQYFWYVLCARGGEGESREEGEK